VIWVVVGTKNAPLKLTNGHTIDVRKLHWSSWEMHFT